MFLYGNYLGNRSGSWVNRGVGMLSCRRSSGEELHEGIWSPRRSWM